jgi:hypothetical protein
VLSAFTTDTALVLAHIDIAEKSNEIPAVRLLTELGLADVQSSRWMLCIAKRLQRRLRGCHLARVSGQRPSSEGEKIPAAPRR